MFVAFSWFWLAGFQPAVVVIDCFIGCCPMLLLTGFHPVFPKKPQVIVMQNSPVLL